MKRLILIILILLMTVAGSFAQVVRHPSPTEKDPIWSAEKASYVPTSRTINGQPLTGNITIDGMVYPGAGIPTSTGSTWGTSITDNSSNWNTAYSWGNHAGLYLPIASTPWTGMGYLTAEADTLATVTGRGATTTNAISTGDITAPSLNNGTGVSKFEFTQTSIDVAGMANVKNYWKLEQNGNDLLGDTNLTTSGISFTTGKVGYGATSTSGTLGNARTLTYTTAWTIGMFVKRNTSGGGYLYSTRPDNNSVARVSVGSTGAVTTEFRNSGAGGYKSTSYGVGVTAGQWIHLAVSYSGSGAGGNVKVYINGVQLGSTSTYTGGAWNTGATNIGSDPQEGINFSGVIDEVTFFERELNSSEIGVLSSIGTSALNDVTIYTNGTKLISATFGGKVGIGSDAPSAKLHVVGTGATSASTSFAVDNSSGSRGLTVLGSGGVLLPSLTATRVPFAGTGGLISDDADMTFATDTLTVTKLSATTSITTTGTITGNNLSGTNTGDQFSDGVTITGDGTFIDPFVAEMPDVSGLVAKTDAKTIKVDGDFYAQYLISTTKKITPPDIGYGYTITRVVVQAATASPTTEFRGDLKRSDAQGTGAFPGANPEVIKVLDTNTGNYDSGVIAEDVATGKELYIQMDSNVDYGVTWTITITYQLKTL